MVCYNVDEQSALMPTRVSNACIWLSKLFYSPSKPSRNLLILHSKHNKISNVIEELLLLTVKNKLN